MLSECDQTFVSRAGGPQSGVFSAPQLLNPTNISRQCLYIFLAGPGQRVDVVFTAFNLRGTLPEYESSKRSSPSEVNKLFSCAFSGAAVGELPG